MKWSLGPIALVFPPTATVTSTVPAEPAGADTVSEVAVADVGVAAVFEPNFTVLFAGVVLNPVPVIVTEVPPEIGPLDGLMPVTVGDVAGNVTEKVKAWLAGHGVGNEPSLHVYRLKLSAVAPLGTEISFIVTVSMPCPVLSATFQVTA